MASTRREPFDVLQTPKGNTLLTLTTTFYIM